MNEAIELALRTWYPKDHPLHLDPIHPAMGLAGETGEILNKRKKDLFKVNYEWSEFDELDELGDIWYYIRILFYQCDLKISAGSYQEGDLDIIRAELAMNAAKINNNAQRTRPFPKELRKCQFWLNTYLATLEISLDKLTDINWQKLKPGSERGNEWISSWIDFIKKSQ